MTDVYESLQKLLPAIWLGMLIGVSFIATPVKFQAGSLSLPVALDVGRVTFHLFSRIEWIMAMLLIMALLAGGSPTRLKIVSCVLLSLILIEGIWLLPNLYARAHAIISGNTPAPSSHHILYAATELLKASTLLVLALPRSGNG